MSTASVEYWHSWVEGLGALVRGPTLFDFTDGWGGLGVPVVVVTHQVPTNWVEANSDAPFHFVTDGVEVERHLEDHIGGIYLDGNGFRTAAAVDELRRRAGKVDVSANPTVLQAVVSNVH